VGGGGFSRKPGNQTDTLLFTPGFRTRAIAKHVVKQHPSFPKKRQTRTNLLKCFRSYVAFIQHPFFLLKFVHWVLIFILKSETDPQSVGRNKK
jgi:hypothetical protein